MDMSAVSRLKKTWAKVNVSKLAILERQLDPSGNFLTYRSTLKAAVWRSAGATKESERVRGKDSHHWFEFFLSRLSCHSSVCFGRIYWSLTKDAPNNCQMAIWILQYVVLSVDLSVIRQSVFRCFPNSPVKWWSLCSGSKWSVHSKETTSCCDIF